jgi:FkbM family methyltransferase
MLNITARRKEQLCRRLLTEAGAVIGFADVGSGGPLKRPWSLLPASQLRKFDFEPTRENDGSPLCVSNRVGKSQFFVARDERGSSLHRPLHAFAERFGRQSHFPARIIEVECTTLDRHFDGRYDLVDAIDVNVEGHDYQVLQGGARLLGEGAVKLLKVEFELVAVWEGQGWLSDIDPLMRAHGYILAGIDIERARPANVQRCFHRGEPLWGKALYLPGRERWSALLQRLGNDPNSVEHAVAKAAALYVAADLPGQAFDIIDMGARAGCRGGVESLRVKQEIEAAYRWARLEYGARELMRLIRRATGLRGMGSEP